jgi:hypothetical protein
MKKPIPQSGKAAGLTKLLKKWQPRLRLEDWNITIRWATAKESEEDWDAKCDPDVAYKSARIVVTKWDEKDKDYDAEYLVLHEILHLPMTPFAIATGSLQETSEENLVHILASLLIALDRGDPSVLGRKLPKVAAIPSTPNSITARRPTHRTTKEEVKIINGGETGKAKTSPTPEADHTGSNSKGSEV